MLRSQLVPRPSLNLILLGTGEHHAEDETVLTLLAKTIEQTPDQHVHVIDGPGGVAPLNSDHPMLGTYHFSCFTNPVTADVIPIKILKKGYMETASTLGGLITGSGCQDAITEAVHYVDAMLTAGKKPLVLNLFGYSRGSDTALRLSNVLHSLYPREEIEINIFAIDPVPGPKRHGSVRSRLVDVHDYEIVLMCDETRLFLVPQDLTQLEVKNPDVLRVHMLNGDHGASKRFRHHPQTKDSPRLLWHAIHAFAKRHGVVFKDKGQIPFVTFDDGRFAWSASGQCRVVPQTETALANEDERDFVRLKLYTRMQLQKKYYQQFSSSIGTPREFLTRKKDYFLHGVHFFQDKEHMQLFQKYYPNFFDYFFQKNKEQRYPNDVIKDIEKMRVHDANLLLLLQRKEYGQVKNFTAETLPAPRGIPVVMTSLYANKELMHLYWNLQTACLCVIGGNDTSISKENAETILHNARKIITGNIADQEKIYNLQALIASVIYQHQNDGVFAFKLVGLVSSQKVVEIKARHLLLGCLEDLELVQNPVLAKPVKDCWRSISSIMSKEHQPRRQAIKITQAIYTLQQQILSAPDSAERKKIHVKTHAFLSFKIPSLQVVDHIITDLDSYLNRFEWFGLFRNGDLTEEKKRIAHLVKQALINLKSVSAGNNLFAIKEIMNLGAFVSGRVHSLKKHGEGRLDKIFRNALLNMPVSSQTVSRLPWRVERIIRTLKQSLRVGRYAQQVGLFCKRQSELFSTESKPGDQNLTSTTRRNFKCQ